jgi:hypothetical protein
LHNRSPILIVGLVVSQLLELFHAQLTKLLGNLVNIQRVVVLYRQFSDVRLNILPGISGASLTSLLWYARLLLISCAPLRDRHDYRHRPDHQHYASAEG